MATALAGGLALNVALLCTFGWTELIAPDVRTALWVVLGAVWVAAAGYSAVSVGPAATPEPAQPTDDGFVEATEHYLKGDYFQAQRRLVELLRRDQRDLDARLMLATLMRHTGRPTEASEQLDVLERLEGAEKWELEIRRERELLAQVPSKADVEPEQSNNLEANKPPAERTHAA